ncbi:MAG: class I SAM-dependent methyltransferase, partial [Acinetobacter sp.]|nr:class I SAM-dependent methyltransferase [Acinetobacter sp.]
MRTGKFASSDTQYLENRKTLSEKYGPRELWSVIDHWPLYAGTANLARYISNYELLKSVQDVPGHIAEFGSWRGANLMFLAKLQEILDPGSSKMIHCFDSFEGLQTFNEADGSATVFRGEYKGSLEELQDFINLYELSDTIKFHIGDVRNTVSEALKNDQSLQFSFVYLDVDLYEPTLVALQECHTRLSLGGLFILDEWG